MSTRRFPNHSTSVRQARRFVNQLPDLAPDLAEAVTVMVSELATNCVRHSDADFSVTVEIEETRSVSSSLMAGQEHLSCGHRRIGWSRRRW